jgi:ribosomal protein S27AE
MNEIYKTFRDWYVRDVPPGATYVEDLKIKREQLKGWNGRQAEIDNLTAIIAIMETKHERMYTCYKEEKDQTHELRKEIKTTRKELDDLNEYLGEIGEIDHFIRWQHKKENENKGAPLEETLKKYPTVKKENCFRCGNPWFFEMEKYWSCTTCGYQRI